MTTNGEITPKRVCSGKTRPEDWSAYSTDAIFVQVDISGCNFQSTPNIVVSLHGIDDHWLTLGTSSVYHAKATGFRVYLKMGSLTPQDAVDKKYSIHYVAVGD